MSDLLGGADEQGGWRHNPRVAIAAGIAAILFVVIGFSCSCLRSCQRRSERPEGLPKPSADIALICPHCKHQYTITRRDLRKIPGRGASVKVTKLPCPKCGKTGSVEALRCRKCGHCFSPVPTARGTPTRVCPHCKKDPWKP